MMDSESTGVVWMRTGLTVYALVVFAVLWVGLATALIVNQTWLDELWLGGLPIAARVGVWVLFLPMTVGLWIWQSAWSSWLRLLGFVGIVGWTALAVSRFLDLVRSR